MKAIMKLDFFLSVLFWCVSFVKLCIGAAETYDYIVIFISTSLIVYDVDKMIKEKKTDNKGQEGN